MSLSVDTRYKVIGGAAIFGALFLVVGVLLTWGWGAMLTVSGALFLGFALYSSRRTASPDPRRHRARPEGR